MFFYLCPCASQPHPLVVIEVHVLHVEPDVLDLLVKARHTVVLQYKLMHLVETQLLEGSQGLRLLVRKNLLKSLTDLTLNPDWNVLLNEVLNHGKVIAVILCLQRQLRGEFI